MRPTRRTVLLTGMVMLLSLAALLGPVWYQVWGAVVVCLAGLALLDALRLQSAPLPEVSRRLDTALPLGVKRPVTLTLRNPTRRAMVLTLYDFHPDAMQAEGLPLQASVPAETEWTHTYDITSVVRGVHRFAPAQVLLRSGLGLWDRSARVGAPSTVHVFPNFQAVARYMMLDVNQRLTQIGIHRRRRRGEGREFHQLREYVQGDAMHHIDWKASARMRKMISRDYRDERDQQIMFLMDCGQSMRAQDGDISHFDHALNAVLLMASVALRHGDAVGLMAFGGTTRMLAPRKGPGQLNLLLNTVFDIQPTLHTSDFTSLAQRVLGHCRKRTLLVLITNLKDEDDDELSPALALMRRRHLVLLAGMRERVLHETLNAEVTHFNTALDVGAVHTYLSGRRQIHERLRAQGVLGLDVEPEQLPTAMVNSYLGIKSQGLL